MKKKRIKTKYKTPGKIFKKQETKSVEYKNTNEEDNIKQTKIVADKWVIDAAFADMYSLMDMQFYVRRRVG
jgi:hypothetical protein